MGENKSSQIISEKKFKTIKLGLNKSQNKSLKSNINEAGRPSSYNRSTQEPQINKFMLSGRPNAYHTSTQWKQNAYTGQRSLINTLTHNNTSAWEGRRKNDYRSTPWGERAWEG